jgi:hypothetical protein
MRVEIERRRENLHLPALAAGDPYCIFIGALPTESDSPGTNGQRIGWARFSMRAELLQQGRDIFTRPVPAALEQATKEAERLAALWAVKWDLLAKPVFVRFGELPAGGRSRNYITGELEAGASCIGLLRNPLTAELMPRLTPAISMYLLFNAGDRPCYQVEGELIGCGSDGEPILGNARIVGPFEWVWGWK